MEGHCVLVQSQRLESQTTRLGRQAEEWRKFLVLVLFQRGLAVGYFSINSAIVSFPLYSLLFTFTTLCILNDAFSHDPG
jgi:hypothetical protein